jgi:hypothetical protein
MSDLFSFCSSFIEVVLDKKDSFNLPSVQVQDEQMFSAFEEIDEEAIKRQKDEAAKQQKQLTEQNLLSKMRSISIDYKAVKLYFKLLKDSLKNQDHN